MLTAAYSEASIPQDLGTDDTVVLLRNFVDELMVISSVLRAGWSLAPRQSSPQGGGGVRKCCRCYSIFYYHDFSRRTLTHHFLTVVDEGNLNRRRCWQGLTPNACSSSIPSFRLGFRANWRAGASQPSRSTGTIFCRTYVAMSLLPYVLRISKYPGAAHTVMFLNMRIRKTHHAVKCQGAANYHAVSQRVHAGCQFSPTSSWCGLGSMFHAPLFSWIAPARQKCTAFTY